MSKKLNKKNKFYMDGDDDGTIKLTDGTEIKFVHYQDCCESVYADIMALQDTGFEDDKSITLKSLNIELVKGYGLRINGYGIPCYNEQNGYYSSCIHIFINGKEYRTIDVDCDLDIADYC